MNRFVTAGEGDLGALVEQCWQANVGDAAIEYSVHIDDPRSARSAR